MENGLDLARFAVAMSNVGQEVMPLLHQIRVIEVLIAPLVILAIFHVVDTLGLWVASILRQEIPNLIRALKNPRVRNWFLYELGWLFLIATSVAGVVLFYVPLGWLTLVLAILVIGMSLAGVFMVERAKPGTFVSR